MAMTLAPISQSRLLATAIPGPRSIVLHAEREKQVTSGFGVTMPVFIERAEGAILEDVDGNRIIDFASGIAVTSVGASNPRVQAQVAEQLDKFSHTCFMVTEYDSFTAVCRWLNEHTPGDFEKRSALFSTAPKPSRMRSKWHDRPPVASAFSSSTTLTTAARCSPWR